MGIEIEKKYTVKRIPEDIDSYPYHVIEQAYLNVHPAIRVRREDDIFYMTYKGARSEKEGEIGQVEYNMPLDEESYDRLASKAEGILIKNKRYLIPLNEEAFEREYLDLHPDLTENIKNGNIKIELDVFGSPYDGMVIAEVEFPDEESAREFRTVEWFDKEVTGDPKYSNAQMSKGVL